MEAYVNAVDNSLKRLARARDADAATHRERTGPLEHLIGSSPVFLRQVDRIPLIASCDAGVLILGETGTGKELFAQAIHYSSGRASHPIVAVNCAALPADLVEAELFGRARGAYTGAHESQQGLIRQADGGTLFLDEIDSLPLPAQAKLLRFLQHKEFRPVGNPQSEHGDVRVIAASNGELGVLAEQGRFRRDLFYRLSILNVRLPALRERLQDLQPLVQHFIARFAREFRRDVPTLSQSALESILAHDWPGNVRELEHAIARGVLLSVEGTIKADDLDLPPAEARARSGESFSAAKARAVERFERFYIERMLLLHGGNITRAAQASAKNRRAFFQLLRKHGIDARQYRLVAE